MSAEPWALELLLPAGSEHGAHAAAAAFADGALLLPELPEAWPAGEQPPAALRCLEPSHGAECTRCGGARSA
jgi:hypothetical protein